MRVTAPLHYQQLLLVFPDSHTLNVKCVGPTFVEITLSRSFKIIFVASYLVVVISKLDRWHILSNKTIRNHPLRESCGDVIASRREPGPPVSYTPIINST